MKIAILGFGREGRSVLGFLKKSKKLRNAELWVLDQNPKVKIPRGAKSQLGKEYLSNLEVFDVVFRSPGIPYNLPQIKKARRSGIKFSSLTKLFFENCRGTIIGITGTKGKGTTATLLYKILKAAGKPVLLAGNIGKPALEILPKIGKNSLVILELSSFQLQDLTISPKIAVVLDVFPDHQDNHLSLNEYYGAKTNIARHQKDGDKVFYFSAKGARLPASGGKNNALSSWVASGGSGKKIAVDENWFGLFNKADLKMHGGHNFRNALMAATVALSLGAPAKTIIKAVKNFPGMEHRLEFVKQIGNIKFYNDSASTNPHTAAAALKAFPGRTKILLAGGQDKNLDYGPLAEAVKISNVLLIVLFGENKKKIKEAAKRTGGAIKLVNTLKEAVVAAYQYGKARARDRDSVVIIFSPGAASFDMFKNYADRGNQFKKTVAKLSK